jgi:hypothetical protein
MSNTTRKLFQIPSDEIAVQLRQFRKIIFQHHPKRHFGFICVGARGLSPLQCELEKTARHWKFKKVANGDVTASSKKMKQSPYRYLTESCNQFKATTKGT